MFVAKTWVKIELVVVDSSSAVFMLCFFCRIAGSSRLCYAQYVLQKQRSPHQKVSSTVCSNRTEWQKSVQHSSSVRVVMYYYLCMVGMVWQWQEPDPILELHVCGKKERKIRDPLQYIYYISIIVVEKSTSQSNYHCVVSRFYKKIYFTKSKAFENSLMAKSKD